MAWDPSVIAAVIGGGVALVGTLVTLHTKNKEQIRRSLDFAAATQKTATDGAAATQLENWKAFTAGLRSQISDLVIENDRCNARVAALQTKNDELGVRCDDLENKVHLLSREINDLRPTPRP